MTPSERKKAARRRYVLANRPKVREQQRRWLAAKRRFTRTPPQDMAVLKRTGTRVQRALKAGTLQREPCLFCDAPKVDAHHHDYSQPLSVTWLCRKHHMLAHRIPL